MIAPPETLEFATPLFWSIATALGRNPNLRVEGPLSVTSFARHQSIKPADNVACQEDRRRSVTNSNASARYDTWEL